MDKLTLALKGAAMGIAEVIPGVSGGTIAFITGIYERLLEAIKSVGPQLITTFKKEGTVGLWKAIDGSFLLLLMIGMALGFGVGVILITDLIETQPEMLWGFFFGLILASCFLIGAEVKHWSINKIMVLIGGALLAYWITVVSPAEGSLNYAYVFLSGVLAISALILPGISGSFVLLILGMYTIIYPLIKETMVSFEMSNLIILSIFGLGCLTGLAVFSRVLTWLFKKYKELSFALLTGFMIGSLNKIWPWRNVKEYLVKETGEVEVMSNVSTFLSLPKDSIKLLSEINVLPDNYVMGDPNTIKVLIALVVGFIVVFLLSKFNKN